MIQGLGDIGDTGGSKVPNVRRVREFEIRDVPRIAMCPARSDDMRVSFLSDLSGQVSPKRLYEKPDTVLRSKRAAHKTREVNLGRGTEFHCVVATEHQIMGL